MQLDYHQMQCQTKSTAAFSLLEISIVLTVIGLLVGGVVAGISLLKQSYMQSLVSDYAKYANAVSQFSQQYGGLPGDIMDATSFWGDDSSNCADASVTNGNPGTCNGNNNSDMSTIAATGAAICKLSDGATNAPCQEPYRAWQQLMLAQLIQGTYTGTASGGGALAGTNVPKAQLDNTGWSLGYKAATSGNASMYDQELLNFMALGANITGNALTQGAALTPTEAWQLDTKLDNGLPGTGRVVTLKPASLANCATSATDASAAYNYQNFQGPACSLYLSLTAK